MHWRRKWQPTPVFLPGESQGRGSLVGCCLWGRTESDTTEATQQQQQQVGEHVEVLEEWSTLRGHGSSVPLPTYHTLHISSFWMFIHILNHILNKLLLLLLLLSHFSRVRLCATR